jgi:hypothetical protein
MIRIKFQRYTYYMHACSKTKYLFPYAEVSVHKPTTRSQFVGALGINFHVESLLQNCTEEQPGSLRTGFTGYWCLVGDDELRFGKELMTALQSVWILTIKQWL